MLFNLALNTVAGFGFLSSTFSPSSINAKLRVADGNRDPNGIDRRWISDVRIFVSFMHRLAATRWIGCLFCPIVREAWKRSLISTCFPLPAGSNGFEDRAAARPMRLQRYNDSCISCPLRGCRNFPGTSIDRSINEGDRMQRGSLLMERHRPIANVY